MLKGVSLRLILKDKGGDRHFICFVNLELEVVRYFLKKKGQQKKGALILKEGIKAPPHTCIGD